jgi:hypothetical protein
LRHFAATQQTVAFGGYSDRRWSALDLRNDPLRMTAAYLAKSISVMSTLLMSRVSLGVCVLCA